jgi:hypothetical protein
MYFLNATALSGDASEARILCLPIEFEVVEKVVASVLIERDSMRTYKIIINEELGQIIFPTR